MEEAFFFEPDGFRLFGMAHRPATAGAATAVVMCHPYGEEKQLSYPVLVRCARLLAGDGFPVLRFDCRGYGDSQGNMEDATIESHIAETVAAGRVARELFGVEGVVFLGLRLGGSVAVRAAEREPATAGLVLWSPIVNGARYVDEMIRKGLFAEMLAGRRSSREEILAKLARDECLEIEGNLLSPRICEEMSTIDLPAQIASFRAPVLLSAIGRPAQSHAACESLARAYETLGVECTFEVAGERAYWERNALYENYIPVELFELTRRWMHARWQTT